jgi:hypothetical protein
MLEQNACKDFFLVQKSTIILNIVFVLSTGTHNSPAGRCRDFSFILQVYIRRLSIHVHIYLYHMKDNEI